MSDVNLTGRNRITGLPNDERYITLDALKKHHEEGTLSIVQVRQFLYDEIGAKELFAGTGETRPNDGGELKAFENISFRSCFSMILKVVSCWT